MKIFIILVASVVAFSGITTVYAQDTPTNTVGNSDNPTNTVGNSGNPTNTVGNNFGVANEIDTVDDVLMVIDRITNWMFTIFLAAAVIMILYAAFVYLTSGGGEETAKAHKMILYSAVAIAVAILARGVVTVIESIVNP